MASVAMKALGDYRLLGILPVRALYEISDRIGKTSIKASPNQRLASGR